MEELFEFIFDLMLNTRTGFGITLILAGIIVLFFNHGAGRIVIGSLFIALGILLLYFRHRKKKK